MASLNADICSCTFLKEEIYGEEFYFSVLTKGLKHNNIPWYCTLEGKDIKVIQVLEIWLNN